MLKIGVLGASGHVGRLILQEIAQSSDICIGSVFIHKNLDVILPKDSLVTNDMSKFIQSCEVIIDFSAPYATNLMLSHLVSSPLPCVIGTTALEPKTHTLMHQISTQKPILYATNMSLGVTLLNRVVKNIAKMLPQADIEIKETHHRFKKDSPSGTALSLAESCASGRGVKLKDVLILNRANQGERKNGEISVVGLRGGDVVGEHSVGFYMQGEYLEFSHIATNRNTFAKGAITCAKWLVKQEPKMYGIDDVFSQYC